MQRISFARITNRASYTQMFCGGRRHHHRTSLYAEPGETKVGVVFAQEFPTDEQRAAIAHLANLATGIDATVIIEFGEGTSPFPGAIPKDHPFASLCTS
jgi:hypothetical protein